MDAIVILFWLMVATISVTSIFFRYLGLSSRNSLLKMMVDKGHPIPPELLQDKLVNRQPGLPNLPWDHRGMVVMGIFLLGLGAAMALFGAAVANGMVFELHGDRRENGTLFFSLFPFSLGVAAIAAGIYLRKDR